MSELMCSCSLFDLDLGFHSVRHYLSLSLSEAWNFESESRKLIYIWMFLLLMGFKYCRKANDIYLLKLFFLSFSFFLLG